jgi:hypothetical protein
MSNASHVEENLKLAAYPPTPHEQFSKLFAER